MSKYVAVDCGKYETKVASYDAESGEHRKFKFRTKISSGTFDDDMLGLATYLVSAGGKDAVYKVGMEARKEAELETSKMTQIHKTCCMTGIAAALADSAGDEAMDIKAVIGIPYQTCCVVKDRLAYKEYMMPEGEQAVTIKRTSNEAPITVRFRFAKKLVYPESIGVLYQYPRKLSGITGIIDIGNLNTNDTYCDSFTIVEENSFTDELGGKIMISGLAQQLTSEMGARVSDDLVAKVLIRGADDPSKRYLMAKNGDKSIEEKSRQIIDAYLLEHVENIKRKCDSRHWPLAFMNLVMIGGTSALIPNEIRKVFGEETFIPPEPEYVNVEGFLKKLCADDGVEIKQVEAKNA